MNVKEEFGLRVKSLRLTKMMSQEKLAEHSGLHRTYISSLELGHRNVSLETIEKLSRALSCEMSDFFKKTLWPPKTPPIKTEEH